MNKKKATAGHKGLVVHHHKYTKSVTNNLLPSIIELKKKCWRELVAFVNISFKSSEDVEGIRICNFLTTVFNIWMPQNLWMHSIMQLLPPTCNAEKV